MNKLLIYPILVYLLFFTGCDKSNKELTFIPPVFKDTVHLPGRILVDTFIMGTCYDIEYYNNYLLVAAYRGDRELVQFFYKDNGKYIKSILPKGRGPGETLAPPNFSLDRERGEVMYYDVMARKLKMFNIDSVIMGSETENHILSMNYPLYMYKIFHGNTCYIAEGGNKDNGKSLRFSIIKNDSVVFKYTDFPNVKLDGISNQGIIPAYKQASTITLSPDKQLLVCGSGYGAILEIFNIKNDRITINTIKGFYKPVFDLKKGYELSAIPNKTIRGFIDLYGGTKYLYSIFSGSTDPKANNNIAVFDWKGNCIKLYTTDYKLQKICVDEINSKIYAHAIDKNYETVIVEFII